VRKACYVLGDSPPGLYDWRSRPPSSRAIRHAWLTDVITAVRAETKGTYGRERMHAELVHGHGLQIGHNTVGLLMRRAGLSGLTIYRRRGKRTPPGVTITDLVNRNFTRTGPNQLWVTDITEHPTREGKPLCCVVLDTLSRRVVGWAIDSRAAADLATNTLSMAIATRAPPARDSCSWGPRPPIHLVVLHKARPASRAPAIPRHGRRPIRQLRHRILLGTHAS